MPAGYISDYVLADGINVHYLDWGGQGSALVFLDGWGCNSYIYIEFAPRFTGHYHVLAVDRRGRGDSDHPDTGIITSSSPIRSRCMQTC